MNDYLVANEKAPSRMFSKAGQDSFDMFQSIRKKDHALNSNLRKKIAAGLMDDAAILVGFILRRLNTRTESSFYLKKYDFSQVEGGT